MCKKAMIKAIDFDHFAGHSAPGPWRQDEEG